MAENARTKTKIPAAKIVMRVPDVFMTVLSVLLMGGMAFARTAHLVAPTVFYYIQKFPLKRNLTKK